MISLPRDKGVLVSIIPKRLIDARGFLQIGLIFWFFLPPYLLTLLGLFWVNFPPIDKYNGFSGISIIWFYGSYFLLGFVVSGVIVYRSLGDKFRISVLARLFLSFLIVFFGGMILDVPYKALIGELPSELMGIGTVLLNEWMIEGDSIEVSIKMALVVSGFYVALSFMLSFIPACVILISTLVEKSRS